MDPRGTVTCWRCHGKCYRPDKSLKKLQKRERKKLVEADPSLADAKVRIEGEIRLHDDATIHTYTSVLYGSFSLTLYLHLSPPSNLQ